MTAAGRTHYITFDTETTGLPPSGQFDPTDNRWPWVIELAWSVDSGDIKSSVINKPLRKGENYAQKIHGITEREIAEAPNWPSVFAAFLADVRTATHLIAHNVSFDYKMVTAMAFRFGMQDEWDAALDGCSILCTMRSMQAIQAKQMKLVDLAAYASRVSGLAVPQVTAHRAAGDVALVNHVVLGLAQWGFVDWCG